jgi:electron transport complex protein RnfC
VGTLLLAASLKWITRITVLYFDGNEQTKTMTTNRFPGGVHLPGNKAPACHKPITPAAIPHYLILPLLQHIGVPAKPVVSIGERVFSGQVIAECADGACSQPGMVPIHASSSGTVVAIENRLVPHASGLEAPCVVIETDGKDEWCELTPILETCLSLAPDELRYRIAKAGIVGLGGAGFPSHIKLLNKGIDTLILNGAECEPYISCDDRLMRDRPAEVVLGGRLLSHVVGGAPRCIIALEDNKPEAFEALSQHVADELSQGNLGNCEVEVVQVPTLYPMGGERQLIRVLTGKAVPRGKFPAEYGIVMHNVETAVAAYRALKFGRPLISRTVTVTGSAVTEAQNLDVLLGTPIRELLEQSGLQDDKLGRLIMGGPMMGITLQSLDMPVIKTTNCIIADTPQAMPPPAMPCIRCGNCEQVCPIILLPQQLYWYAKAKDFDKVEDHNIFDCIECGCCSYVCPSNIPLVHYYRYAKAEIRARRQEKEKAEQARKRHEFKTFRIERDKRERQEKHKKAAAKINQGDADHKKAVINDAVERVRAKRAAQQDSGE